MPVERLSLLSFNDLRLALVGELYFNVPEWKAAFKYEAPYFEVIFVAISVVLVSIILSYQLQLCSK